jgi:D-psicose/D-tagatose/L-ribulose 3-epimerase
LKVLGGVTDEDRCQHVGMDVAIQHERVRPHPEGKSGFDILEVALEDVSIIDANLLRKMTEDKGLAVTVCGAFGPTRDVSSDDPAIRKNGADYMRESIRFAEQVGANIFAGPVYSAVGKTRLVPDEQKKREWAWCVEKLREVGKAAAEAGVTIGVEPLNRFEQAVKLVRDVGSPACKIHLDTFHANIEEKSIPDAIRKLGKGMLCHIHACENDRGIPGTGHGLERYSRSAA